MKISIVTVCFNAESIIEETIKSVISQTYKDIEYIIIDGNSTDSTMSIIKKYADKIHKIISEPDKGIYDAMNKGISLASGTYINFMNAGDTFSSPDAVENVVSQIAEESDIVYGDSTMIGYNGHAYFDSADTEVSKINKKPIYRHNASFTRTSLHKKFPFETEKKAIYRHALDYNNIFTLWHNGAKFQKVNVDVVTWEKSGTSDREILNIKLMYKISHQFRKPTIYERLIYMYDYIKACRRDILRKLHGF